VSRRQRQAVALFPRPVCLVYSLRRPEACLGLRGIPAKGFIFVDQDIGVAVAGEIYELRSGVFQLRIGRETKRVNVFQLSSCVRS
jgi:hypothetical protein